MERTPGRNLLKGTPLVPDDMNGAQAQLGGAGRTLVCFAVKEEAQPFRQRAGGVPEAQSLITGIGARNAESAIRRVLASGKPAHVFTCGFAGGLKPELVTGDVIFDAGGHAELAACLEKAGARAGGFHCAPRVAVSAREKAALRGASGADAVEMESQIIASICREHTVPCAIVRVVLDAADEDLPLDFNTIMNANQEMDYARLAWAILKAPAKLGALMTLQKQSRSAAESLAAVLERALLCLREREVRARR